MANKTYIFLKKIYSTLPATLKRLILSTYEYYYYKQSKKETLSNNKNNTLSEEISAEKHNVKKNILFYHVSGLSFGGTEKFLQIIAKHLDKRKYNTFFMYSPKSRSNVNGSMDGRMSYLKNSGINLIPFSYSSIKNKFPYTVYNMDKSIDEVLNRHSIDLFVTAGSGYSEFPINIIRKIPIFLINIFGSPIRQKNVVKNICISNSVRKKTEPITDKKTYEIMYIPSEGPDLDASNRGKIFRQSLGIKDEDFVFGRIGRADNEIFDPIGINAFKQVVKSNPNAHYIIVSPCQLLKDIIANEKIPNTHLIPPISDEKDIWSFHGAIDALAHFRRDGESCGLNIIESMLSKKPIISHYSDIWNAQAEYLDSSFSRIAKQNDFKEYAMYMEEFISLKKDGKIDSLNESAYKKAQEIAHIDSQIKRFEKWIQETLTKLV